MAAVKPRHVETWRWLLRNRADVDAQTNDSGHSALIIAAESWEPGNELVELLLALNADPRLARNKGMTALLSAIVKKNVARVEILLAAGADSDIKATVEDQKEQLKQQSAAGVQEQTPQEIQSVLDQLESGRCSTASGTASGTDQDSALTKIAHVLRTEMLKQCERREGLARWKTSDAQKLLQDPELGGIKHRNVGE
eukprot:1844328-Rhodomonas_salina.2